MKKFVLTLVLLATTLFFATLSFYKNEEAIREQKRADANGVLAQKHREAAEAAQKKAEEMAAEAIIAQRQAELAIEELEKCRNK